MSELKYKTGFVLIEARCLNCVFFYGDYSFSLNFHELKEDIFALVEKQHSDLDSRKKIAVCGKKRELQIRFVNAVREIK